MPSAPFYGSAKWRKTREEHLRRFPACKVCKDLGLFGKAVEVDHIIAMAAGGAPFDHANLRGLCKSHHSQKTAVVDHPGRQSRLLVTTGADGFPIAIEKPRSIYHGPKKFT